MQPVQIDQPSQSALPPRHRGFGLSPLMLVPAGIVVAANVISPPVAAGGSTTGRGGGMVGGIIGGLGAALLVSWFAWLASRRGRRAANYAFAITALLMALAHFGMKSTARHQGVAVVNRQMQALRERQAALESAQQALAEAGGLDVTPPRDAAAAADRLPLAEAYAQRAREFIDAGDAATANVATALFRAVPQAQDREEALSVFERNLGWSRNRPQLLLAEQVALAARDGLALLRDRPGQWSVDATGDIIMTGDDAADATEAFDRIRARLAETSEAAQRAAVAAASRPALHAAVPTPAAANAGGSLPVK